MSSFVAGLRGCDLVSGKTCPACGKPMLFIYGNGWDYDLWYCPCGTEIELTTTTTCPDEAEQEKKEQEA